MSRPTGGLARRVGLDGLLAPTADGDGTASRPAGEIGRIWLDAGNFSPGEGGEEARVKTRAVLDALAALDAVAANVAEREVATGLDLVAAEAEAAGVPLVSASWVDADTGEPVWPEAVIASRGGAVIASRGDDDDERVLRVGVVGLAAPEGDAGAVLGSRRLVARPPVIALEEGIARLREAGGVDAIILLASLPEEELLDLVTAREDLALVVSGRHRTAPFEDLGSTLIAFPHSRGQSVSEVALGIHDDGGAFPRRFHLLDRFYPSDPVFLERERVVSARLVELAGERAGIIAAEAETARAAPAASFIGPRACRSCHPRVYLAWEGDPHGSRRPSAAVVGCEACHGNGRLHATSAGRERLRTPLESAWDACATCHPGPTSPHSPHSPAEPTGPTTPGELTGNAAWRRLAHPSRPPPGEGDANPASPRP